MDIALLSQRLLHVEIRRLILLFGLLVGIVVVSQCFGPPFGITFYFSSVNKGSTDMMFVSDSLNYSKSKNVIAVNLTLNDTDALNLEKVAGSKNEIKEARMEKQPTLVEIFQAGAERYKAPNLRTSADSNETEHDNKISKSSQGMLKEGMRNLHTYSVSNVGQIMEIQEKNTKLSSWSRVARSKMQPTTISQMNSLLHQGSLSYSTVCI